ncbi:GNAT family N-acetyltransferase [Thermophilibacter sp.]
MGADEKGRQPEVATAATRLHIKGFDALPEEAVAIRTAVFMSEQGFVDEFDDTDDRACHLVLFDGEQPVATLRLFAGETPGEWVVGRLAVARSHRGLGLGALTLREAEAEAARRGGGHVILHAQVRSKGFYERCGYEAYGEVDLDEGCPHTWMRKEL